MKTILHFTQGIHSLHEEKCSKDFEQYKFKMRKQQYAGFWSKPIGLRKKMEIQNMKGRGVRCIDCVKRKDCNHLRTNKHTRKPCKDYVVDLAKQSRLINQKIKENEEKKRKEREEVK